MQICKLFDTPSLEAQRACLKLRDIYMMIECGGIGLTRIGNKNNCDEQRIVTLLFVASIITLLGKYTVVVLSYPYHIALVCPTE